MKKVIWGLVRASLLVGLVLIGVNAYAGNGDLYVTGNLGVGTTTPAYKVDVRNAGPAYITAENTNNAGQALYGVDSAGVGYAWSLSNSLNVGTLTAYPVLFWTDNVERMRIASGGYVGIGTASPAYLLDVNGQARINGVVYGSSRTLKDNIVDLTSSEALDALNGLNPVKFNYKTDEAEKHVGFIAEDVPDLVAKNARTGIDPMDIVAVLTKVAQEQKKTLETLEAKLAKLEAEMQHLKSMNLTARIVVQ